MMQKFKNSCLNLKWRKEINRKKNEKSPDFGALFCFSSISALYNSRNQSVDNFVALKCYAESILNPSRKYLLVAFLAVFLYPQGATSLPAGRQGSCSFSYCNEEQRSGTGKPQEPDRDMANLAQRIVASGSEYRRGYTFTFAPCDKRNWTASRSEDM